MKLIDFLLRLYPEEFRSRFGRDMREFHRQRMGEPNPGWLPVLRDHFATATVEHMRAIGPDIRYTLRGMSRRPVFTLIVILTIALGIAANTVMFSMVNGILLRPLPYPEPNRLVTLGHEPPTWLVSEPQFAEYRNTLKPMQSLAAYTQSEVNLDLPSGAERVPSAAVTPTFFATIGVPPELGRTFAEGEDRTRPSPVVVVSYRLWQDQLNGNRQIVGQSLMMNGIPRTIIGVMPQGFAYPSPETRVWLPICSQRTCASLVTIQPDSLDGWGNHYLFAIGRLREHVSVDQARDEANQVARRIVREHPGFFNPAAPLVAKVASLKDALVGASRPYLVALLGAAGFLLLIVCANVANLLLARSEGRRREMALRAALGASRRRLVNQLLTESVVLAVTGGILGLMLAYAGTRILVAAAPPSIARLDQVRISLGVVVFCFAVALLAGLLFGIIPAWRAAREAPAESLRSAGKGKGQQQGSRSAQRMLAIGEVAIALVLLAGSGMLLKSLVHLNNSDIGFEPGGTLTALVSPNPNTTGPVRSIQLYRSLLEQLRAIPGVQVAGAARWLPVVDAGGMWDIRIEGKEYPPGEGPTAVPQEVTPGFFAAMGMRVIAGRDIAETDREDAPLVGLINRTFARRIWGDESPLGKRFRLGSDGMAWITVVGVVADIQARGFGDTPEPSMYVPHAQSGRSSYFVPSSLSIVMRTSGDPLAFETPFRRLVRGIDPGAPVSRVRTLQDVVGSSIANRRFGTTLIGGFAALSLLLAGIGLYGVISYAVSQRTFEIGVRMALGADRGQVLRMVLGEGGKIALIGMLIGILGAIGLARAIRSMLVGVSLVDPLVLIAGGVLAAVVALAASLIPAKRATVVDPSESLRGGE